MFEVIKSDKNKFAIYKAIYSDLNRHFSFDWNDSLGNSKPDGDAYFIIDQEIIGGFALADNTISLPFLAPPFGNKEEYWQTVLRFAVKTSGQNELIIADVPEDEAAMLILKFGAKQKRLGRRMIRPTEQYESNPGNGFYFDSIREEFLEKIISVVYKAHSTGFTSTVMKQNLDDIKEAVERRFRLFNETSTIYMGSLVRNKINNEIAGVCLAGIYPDSPNSFATIHQVSVLPEYRRQGIATAMLRRAINDAYPVSPAITLGVLVGNPAEILYRNNGFIPGPAYSELSYRQIILRA